MNRTLVIGDIHGGYIALMQALGRACVTSKDKLIFLGDYVDGWSESDKVVDQLIKLSQTQECVFLRGNHETLLTKWLETGVENPVWDKNGGESTKRVYSKEAMSEERRAEHLAFFYNLQNYYLDPENRLFVHAGFTNPRGVKAEFFPEYLYWDRTLWEMAMAMDPTLEPGEARFPQRLMHYTEIFIGHTPVTNFGYEYPTNFANVWNIDTGAAFLGRVSILDVETKAFWQSDKVADFYPLELGRNAK